MIFEGGANVFQMIFSLWFHAIHENGKNDNSTALPSKLSVVTPFGVFDWNSHELLLESSSRKFVNVKLLLIKGDPLAVL